jgi:hypothetical protein
VVGIELHFAKPMEPELLLGLLQRFASQRVDPGEPH